MSRDPSKWHPIRQVANEVVVDAVKRTDEALARADSLVGFSALGPSRQSGVLMYHSVGDLPSYVWTLDADRFEADLRTLVETHEVVDLSEVLDPVRDGEPKRLALTFDDGFVNFYTTVLPLLREYELPATVYVSSAFVGDAHPGLIRERHEMTALPDRILMDEAELSALVDEDLITIGNHTRTHPRLSTLDAERKREEILGAKADLEARFDITVDRFCYPYGDFDAETVDIVAESHDSAVTVDCGLVTQTTDRYRIPRVSGDDPSATLHWRLTDLRYAPAQVLGRLD